MRTGAADFKTLLTSKSPLDPAVVPNPPRSPADLGKNLRHPRSLTSPFRSIL